MADKTKVQGVAGRGHFTRNQSSLENDRSQAREEEKQLKEKLLDEKMKLIRQKNEERLKRQKEIEEDIKFASLHSSQVADEKPAVAEHKMAGVQKESSSAPTRMRGRARGRILAKMAREELQAHRFENKRKQNYTDVENDLQDEKKRDFSPRGGSSSFLSDNCRVDMSKVSSRSSHSWGGSQFEDVVDKVNKEKHIPPRKENQSIEVSMTGKERKQYLEWKEERNRIDRERKLRQKTGESWKREWDREKSQREVHSTHERLDFHHTRDSGQTFGGRTRQKPDWDLHDDRVPEKDLHHPENNRENENDNCEEGNDQNSIANNNKEEDWEDNISVGKQSESGLEEEAISTKNFEDRATTSINKLDDSNTNNKINETVDNEVIDLNIPKECHTADRQNSKLPEETVEPRDSNEEASTNNDIKKLMVTIDSKGNGNIADQPINNNISPYPVEMKDMVRNEKNESNDEAVNPKQDEIIEQPKPQRICKKHQSHQEDKGTQSTEQEKDLTKEVVEKKETISLQRETQGETNATIKQFESDSSTNSTSDSSSHHEKSKESLPKLEIKKTDENNEPVPDFLKTPQKKNWADCEFDEELDLPPVLEWFSLTK